MNEINQLLRAQERWMEKSIDSLPLRKQLEIYERNARYTTDGLSEHCRLKAEQIRYRLREQIDYYEVITNDF